MFFTLCSVENVLSVQQKMFSLYSAENVLLLFSRKCSLSIQQKMFFYYSAENVLSLFSRKCSFTHHSAENVLSLFSRKCSLSIQQKMFSLYSAENVLSLTVQQKMFFYYSAENVLSLSLSLSLSLHSADNVLTLSNQWKHYLHDPTLIFLIVGQTQESVYMLPGRPDNAEWLRWDRYTDLLVSAIQSTNIALIKFLVPSNCQRLMKGILCEVILIVIY